jgi:hypothetical protein
VVALSVRRPAGPLALAVATLLIGCATPVVVDSLADSGEFRVDRVALVPLRPPTLLAANGEREALAEASELVTARVLGALVESGSFDVIPPQEVSAWLKKSGVDPATASGAELGAVLQQAFGADAYLSGRVFRFRARRGIASAAAAPASVRFDLELRAHQGALLWRGVYDETQRSLSDDAGSFGRAFSRGFRWVSAEELAQYGADALVARLEEARPAWK